jgi:hypothetical protein
MKHNEEKAQPFKNKKKVMNKKALNNILKK